MTAKTLDAIITSHWTAAKNMLWYEGEWWTAERVFSLVDQNVERLKESGFGSGDRIVAMLPNGPAFASLCIACWKLGGAIVTLNPLSGLEVIGKLFRHAKPAIVVTTPDMWKKAKKKKPILTRLIRTPVQTINPNEALSESFKAKPSTKCPDNTAMIFYTSGTTGMPKGVPLTHENIVSCTEQTLEQVLPDIHEQTVLNVLPNFHTLGCVVSGIMPLLVGVPQVIRSNFMPVEGTMRAIDEGGATLLITVPTLLHFLCGAAAKKNWKPRNVKYIVSGGDRLSNVLRERITEYLGGRPIEGYGLTECSPILAAQTSSGPYSPEGSVGKLLSRIEYKLFDVEGNPAKGNEGVLWVKGPNVASQYYNAPEITAEKMKDGWFNTGDMVTIDENKNVFIMERVSDLIIVGGFNVYPQEVEAVLNECPGVSESAVVGVSRSVTGQMVRAFVIPEEGAALTSSQLTEWCRDRLPHYKVPRSVKIVSELPRNALGKVLRRKLRDI